jgi:hypothetical protein
MMLRVTNTRKPNVILAIDDDWLVLDSFKQLSESQGWAVCAAEGILTAHPHNFWRISSGIFCR